MTLFHSFANDTVKNFVEESPELKKFLTELNHKYGMVAFCKQSEQISLLWPNNFFFGHIFVYDKFVEKKSTHVKIYAAQSLLLEKERGRGTDRYKRCSENLSHLLKLIKPILAKKIKQMQDNPGVKLSNARDSVRRMLDSHTRKSKHNSQLTGTDEYTLLHSIVNKEPIPEELRDKALGALNVHKQIEAENLEKENLLRKFDKVHMIFGSSATPVFYGIANLVDDNYVIQGEVKPCFDDNDLPEEVAVHMKMHRIANEESFEINKVSGPTPMHSRLITKDWYDATFETVTYYATSVNHQGVKYIYATPVQPTHAN